MENFTQLKQAIIGKAWVNGVTPVINETIAKVPAPLVLPTDMTFHANESYLIGDMTFRTDRNITIPVEVKANQKLFFYANKKREGMQDADYSVSISLPVAEADAIIENSRAGAEAWKAANMVASA